jgi:hypothetical protein
MDSPDKKGTETPEEFLSRWSRRKQQARVQPPEPVPAAAPPAAQEAAPALPPVEGLNMDSDFRGFLHPKVDESLRRAALNKLFHEPHFNVMDGLDTYIDDYSASDPIPEAMLKQMRNAQDILAASKERRETAALQEEAERRERADGQAIGAEPAQPEAAAALPEPSPVSDEVVQSDSASSPQKISDDGAQRA